MNELFAAIPLASLVPLISFMRRDRSTEHWYPDAPEDLEGLPAHQLSPPPPASSIQQGSGLAIPEGFEKWTGDAWDGPIYDVANYVTVEVLLDNGMRRTGVRASYNWSPKSEPHIIAYRIVEEQKPVDAFAGLTGYPIKKKRIRKSRSAASGTKVQRRSKRRANSPPKNPKVSRKRKAGRPSQLPPTRGRPASPSKRSRKP